MGQFDATKGKQALEIRSSLSERRALTDSIMPSDSPDLAHAHSRQWAKAHGEFKKLYDTTMTPGRCPYFPSEVIQLLLTHGLIHNSCLTSCL